jgi:hypothetical protein
MNTAPHALHTLLDRSVALPPEYGRGLTTHLPMALQALDALGATSAQMARFFVTYSARFGAAADDAPFHARRIAFGERIAAQGADAVVAQALPGLWPGAAGAAFHGLIRTAHAVQAGHAGELAAALAYWSLNAAAVPEVATSPTPLPFAQWSDELETAALATRGAARLISARIAQAVQSPAYARLAAALASEDTTLEKLSGWAASLYARSGNFTVLHLVTGLRAARVLLARWPAPESTTAALVRAVTAAALASNLATRDSRVPLRSWAEVREAALVSDDDHVIKLVHACIDDAAVYGEGERLAAASRVLA